MLYRGIGLSGYANPLMDSTGDAALALSLRKLRTAYAGNCIKVRRSSDDTEQDIGFSSDVLDESALTTFVGAGDGFVSVWYDQGAAGNNATQTTTAFQPKIVSAGTVIKENTCPIIDFGTNGNKWHLELPTGFIYNIATWSYFHVAKITDFANSNTAVFGPYNTTQTGLQVMQHSVIGYRAVLRINNEGDGSFGVRKYAAGRNCQLWDNATLCVTAIYNDATANTLNACNNIKKILFTKITAAAALNFNGIYQIGKYAEHLGDGYNVYGKIAELLIFTSSLYATRYSIQMNMMSHYNIKLHKA